MSDYAAIMQAEDQHPTGDDVPHTTREIPVVAALSDSDLLRQIARDAADTRQDIAAILTKVQEVSAQVKPTLDSLMSHPMLKMFLR